MFPTLVSLGPITISSFGFFLSGGFLFATFLAWRLARAWDLPEEKILDLCLLTFFGSLIGARVAFVLADPFLFNDDFSKIFLLTKYPGLNFWGGLLSGTLTLFFFTKRIRKMEFWQVADLSSIGLLGGLILGQVGCLLGGCNVGIVSNFLGVDLVGYLGKRFPVQALESLVFALVLLKLWPVATHFHFSGKIASLVLITLGLIELMLGFLKDEKSWIFAIAAFGIGSYFFYRLSKRNLKIDLFRFGQILWGSLTDERIRGIIRKRLSKSWYGQKAAFHWSTYQLKKRLVLIRRRARVKPTPEL